MKRKNILKFVSLLGIGSFVMLAAASCTQATTPTPNPKPTPNPNPPSGGMNGGNTNPGNGGGMDNSAKQLAAAKTEAKAVIDASAELSDSVKEALKRQVDATTTGPAARDLKTKAEALVSAVKALSGSVTAAKTLQAEEQYTNVSQDFKTTLEAKLTAATALLEDGTKLKNLDASGNLDTTKASLESSKTDLDAAVAAVKPELTFAKTKASVVKTASELRPLVNEALLAELQKQANDLPKNDQSKADKLDSELKSLKASLTSLQDLVSKGLAMQVDYPQKYYDADNKDAFDAALLKASSVFPAFKWTAESIMVPDPTNGALPNPRAWTKARDKSEFKLQNFVMAPAQAAAPTPTEPAAAESASAIVRVANGEAASPDGAVSREAQTTPAPAPMADLASTVSYLKSLNDSLKAESDKLNGDTTTNKTAYYKLVEGRTLYWDGFMPKIVVEGYQPAGHGSNKDTNETTNREKLKAWFGKESNWTGLSEQLTKKLGAERFKNVKLTFKDVIYETISTGSDVKIPKVTFTVAAKDGYQLGNEKGTTTTLELKIRVLYTSQNQTQNALKYQGVSFSREPSQTRTINDANVKANVNVYLNYTGPAIVLDADLPAVGSANNTTINGTSPIKDTDLATKVKALLNKTANQNDPTDLMKAITKYVQTFDPKYLSTRTDNGYRAWVSWMQVEDKGNGKVLHQRELKQPADIFLQQMKDDTEAVYLAIGGTTDDQWLNAFLIRIPLTKFVKPLTTFTATPASAPAQTGSGTGSTQQAQSSSTTDTTQTDGNSTSKTTDYGTKDDQSQTSNTVSKEGSGDSSENGETHSTTSTTTSGTTTTSNKSSSSESQTSSSGSSTTKTESTATSGTGSTQQAQSSPTTGTSSSSN
ncbi:variably expressed lipoprotein and hemagglutinin (VlhA) family protein [Mycoplasmoides gallisepticum str. F]|uniref:GA module-containing protein n=1 Tax=Mycoplasmoides gallisepticum TaxID=2096 RepID=UPI0001C399EB|nr:GA module-containing protein [Mycoplasmoides gallisepticum]ADC31145.1 variably expressed lipoprotein and hemagglutinin (VlhA) family protein [Mycoplasmoides gallisepticum str. F]